MIMDLQVKLLFKNLQETISKVFASKKVNDENLILFEDTMIQADIDIDTAEKIINELKLSRFSNEVSVEDIQNKLIEIISKILKSAEAHYEFDFSERTKVILFIGVNGAGKTTTIAKFAKKFKANNNSILLVAGDTFRAAATEQLSFWAEKLDTQFIKGEKDSDPASIAYKSIEIARNNNNNILLIDTAGRLQNKSDLMDQLGKIDRTLKKLNEEYPNETIIILDATTGQNAIKQIEEFNKYSKISGIVMTKYDGSASGGTLISIANKFDIPIYALGNGEALDDLELFNAEKFATQLFAHF